MLDDVNFRKVFNDPNVILRVLRSNLDQISESFEHKHHDALHALRQGYPEESEKAKAVKNLIQTVHDEMVNL